MRFIYVLAGVALVLSVESAAATATKYFQYRGYVDASYNYLLRSNEFTSHVNDRLYDIEQNGFTLQQAALTLSHQPDQGFGWLINPFIGRDTNNLAPYGWDPYYGSQTIGFLIPQAYLQYSWQSFTLRGGSLLATSGAETFNPLHDVNFSRSLLDAFAEPGTFLGVRGIYTINDNYNVFAGINNGWDTIRDYSRQKTIELGGNLTFNSIFSLSALIYTGMERVTQNVDSGSVGRRNLFDLVGIINVTDAFVIVLNADYGMQTKATLPNGNLSRATWEGLASYFNYTFTPQWKTSLRGELFYDQSGYQTGVRQFLREVTATVIYSPCKQFDLEMESRHDFSNVPAFLDTNGINRNSQQQSYALNAIYKF